jgi:hypothetical protein
MIDIDDALDLSRLPGPAARLVRDAAIRALSRAGYDVLDRKRGMCCCCGDHPVSGPRSRYCDDCRKTVFDNSRARWRKSMV